MRRIAPTLLCVLSLVSASGAGTVSGKAVGWAPAVGTASRLGVVWLEGGTARPASRPHAVMGQQGGKFIPAFLIVVAGQTVELPNWDDVAHNVYSLSPAKPFNLGFYAKGDKKSVTFDQPGLEEVACSIHDFMHAKILVLPTTYYATIAADGSFQIRGVPAGKYALKFWADGMTSISREIEVSADGTTYLNLMVSSPASRTQQ